LHFVEHWSVFLVYRVTLAPGFMEFRLADFRRLTRMRQAALSRLELQPELVG
jgi:hypothetical protein